MTDNEHPQFARSLHDQGDVAPGRARGHARAVLHDRGIHGEVISNVELIVSELVTNAVQANTDSNLTVPDPVGIQIVDRGRNILIEVADASTNAPDPQAPQGDAEHGRGLLIVDALATSWGTYPRELAGKVVWAKVSCSPGGLG